MTTSGASGAAIELPSLPLSEVLERVAARTPAPGGGSSAAIACALAASLVEMAASFQEGAGERRAAAAQLRARALELAQQDLVSYQPVLEALRLPSDDPERPGRMRAALAAAASVPVGIVETASEVAAHARAATDGAGRHLLGDSATAALLAEAAGRAAALLVELNLHGTADPRLDEVQARVQAAGVDSQQAVRRARDK